MFGALHIPIWIFVAIGVILAVVILFRTMNQVFILSLIKNNFFYFFLFLFVALFAISAINIHSTHSFDFSTLDGWKGLMRIYLSWFSDVMGNLAQITGYAVQKEWVVKGNVTG